MALEREQASAAARRGSEQAAQLCAQRAATPAAGRWAALGEHPDGEPMDGEALDGEALDGEALPPTPVRVDRAPPLVGGGGGGGGGGAAGARFGLSSAAPASKLGGFFAAGDDPTPAKAPVKKAPTFKAPWAHDSANRQELQLYVRVLRVASQTRVEAPRVCTIRVVRWKSLTRTATETRL